jgi:hypothetical protein
MFQDHCILFLLNIRFNKVPFNLSIGYQFLKKLITYLNLNNISLLYFVTNNLNEFNHFFRFLPKLTQPNAERVANLAYFEVLYLRITVTFVGFVSEYCSFLLITNIG